MPNQNGPQIVLIHAGCIADTAKSKFPFKFCEDRILGHSSLGMLYLCISTIRDGYPDNTQKDICNPALPPVAIPYLQTSSEFRFLKAQIILHSVCTARAVKTILFTFLTMTWNGNSSLHFNRPCNISI